MSVTGELNLGLIMGFVKNYINPDAESVKGMNVKAALIFPGFDEQENWGFTITANATVEANFGKKPKSKGEGFIRSLFKNSATVNYEFNRNTSGIADNLHEWGDYEAGGTLGPAGAQWTFDKDTGDVSGAGLKLGLGLDAGLTQDMPMFGVGVQYNPKEGMSVDGALGSP